MKETIAIVGAGVAGLTVARALRSAGFGVHVFDKGRGYGGRLATRRTREGPVFDHGVQYITARGARFRGVVNGAVASGLAAEWDIRAPGGPRYVGMPDMVSFAGHLARAIDVRVGAEVTALSEAPGGWTVDLGGDTATFDRVVLTVPAPQAATLLGSHPIAETVSAVMMAPSLTLMARFPADGPPAFETRSDGRGPLAWIARQGARPGRADDGAWVAQASEAWSRAHLEAEKDEIAALMLPHLAEAIGRGPDEAVLAKGHRWRYARAVRALGVPFLRNEPGTLWVGGDWCLGARVEDAWESGASIADAIVRASL